MIVVRFNHSQQGVHASTLSARVCILALGPCVISLKVTIKTLVPWCGWLSILRWVVNLRRHTK